MIVNNTKYERFESPEAYLGYLNTLDYGFYAKTAQNSFLGDSWNQAKWMLQNGSTKYVSDAQAIVNKMADQQIFSAHPPVMETRLVGFCPNVPAALAGQPYDMFNFVESEEQSLTTPISIYVETLVSAGVSHTQLTKRGVATMALALALNSIRPVELYTVCISRPHGSKYNSGIVCQIPTKPLDIERAAFMLCDPAYTRRLAFQAMADQAGAATQDNVSPWGFNGSPTSEFYIINMRLALQLNEDDIFISGGHSTDKLMLTDPIAWVKSMIAKHTASGDVQ